MTRTTDLESQVDAFLEASVNGWAGRAARLLDAEPRIAGHDLATAAVLGDHGAIAAACERDPAAATTPDHRRGWPPLTYACRSVWHHSGPDRAIAVLEVVRLLLEAGASPNAPDAPPASCTAPTRRRRRPNDRRPTSPASSAASPSGIGAAPGASGTGGTTGTSGTGGTPGIGGASGIVGIGVASGAGVIGGAGGVDGAPPAVSGLLAYVAGHRQRECLRLLLQHGATVAGSGALAAAVAADDALAVHLLLDAGADPGRTGDGPTPPTSTATANPSSGGPRAGVASGHLADGTMRPLPHAVAMGAALPVVEALLDAGAHVDAVGADGRSPLRLAVRRGRFDLVRALLHHAAHDDTTEIDRFIGACTHADRSTVGHVLTRHPRIVDELDDEDRGAIVDAADYAGGHAVEVMLEFGFDLGSHRPSDGATAVHAAAYSGRANLVRRLAERGADIDAPDRRRGATPLTWAIAGSQDRPAHNPDADWASTVRALIDAGAAVDGIVVPPGPDEIVDLLTAQGLRL
jgi:ankyrin repeat protein